MKTHHTLPRPEFGRGETITPISDVFRDSRQYYLAHQKRIRDRLRKLPRKGSVVRRLIKGHYYYYLIYRDDQGKFIAEYMGKVDPIGLKKKIEERRRLRRELRLIDTALYALGVARRADHVGLSKRFAVFERDNFTCQYCGRSVRQHKTVLVVDHIQPKKRGGEDQIDNLMTACVECNSGKRARLLRSAIQ